MGLRTEHLVINTYIYYTKYSVYASKQMPEDCKSSFSNNILQKITKKITHLKCVLGNTYMLKTKNHFKDL